VNESPRLVDGVGVPVCPVHQVLEDCDAEGVLQHLQEQEYHPWGSGGDSGQCSHVWLFG
jgi:hypothetical protein